MQDRRKLNWKHPLVVAAIGYGIAALIQWGAIQSRLNGLETSVTELRSEIQQISVAIIVRHQ
jgi:hypothetical protein